MHAGKDMLSAAGEARSDKASYHVQCACEEERGPWLAEQLQDTGALAFCILESMRPVRMPMVCA